MIRTLTVPLPDAVTVKVTASTHVTVFEIVWLRPLPPLPADFVGFGDEVWSGFGFTVTVLVAVGADVGFLVGFGDPDDVGSPVGLVTEGVAVGAAVGVEVWGAGVNTVTVGNGAATDGLLASSPTPNLAPPSTTPITAATLTA